MPTYEYACTSCGQHVEAVQRIDEPPLTTCGACGGSLRKVFHPAGIVFKGGGFYATDNRGKRSSTASEGSGSGSGAGGSSSTTTSTTSSSGDGSSSTPATPSPSSPTTSTSGGSGAA